LNEPLKSSTMNLTIKEGTISVQDNGIEIKDHKRRTKTIYLILGFFWILFGVTGLLLFNKNVVDDKQFEYIVILIIWIIATLIKFKERTDTVLLFSDIEKVIVKRNNTGNILKADFILKNSKKRSVIIADYLKYKKIDKESLNTFEATLQEKNIITEFQK